MCEVLDVSQSGYYAWRSRPKSTRDRANEDLLERILEVHKRSRKTYGYPRVHAELKRDGVKCSQNRVARLMRLNGIVSRRHRKYRNLGKEATASRVAANVLNRQFTVKAPNSVWASDITSLWSGSGWVHLAVVMDLYSRRIVGWAMQRRITDQLPLAALKMAVESRRIDGDLLHHSDQGTQYTSAAFQNRLSECEITCSMSRKGDCYDNAVVESFFKTLKAEVTRDRKFDTRENARTALFEYIEIFYNRVRLHSTLGYQTPVEYELKVMS